MRTGSFTITVGGATRSRSLAYLTVSRYSRPIRPTPVPIVSTENDRTSTPAGSRDPSAVVNHAASMSSISIGIVGLAPAPSVRHTRTPAISTPPTRALPATLPQADHERLRKFSARIGPAPECRSATIANAAVPAIWDTTHGGFR